MQPDQPNPQPFGQPTNPNPSDPPYTPQPLPTQPTNPGSKKKLLPIVVSIVAAILLALGLVWWMSKSAQENYRKAAESYKQSIKTERDAMNTELDTKDIGPSDAEAQPIFEDHSKKMLEIVARAPKQPKVLGFIPVSVDSNTKNEISGLTTAATNYANALHDYYAIYVYYTEVAEAFKPFRDLGSFTALNESAIKEFAAKWPGYQVTFEGIKPPKELESMYQDLLAQNKVIGVKIAEISDNYATNGLGKTDQLMSELGVLTKQLNKTFTEGILGGSDKAFETVNSNYDALDALLK